MGYPFVHIINSTGCDVLGEVKYASVFCADDDYAIPPGGSWTASSRGACLVTKVSATVNEGGKMIQAEPYTSSGTSYSQFAIVSCGGGRYVVTRITDGVEDKIPADHIEPTSTQK